MEKASEQPKRGRGRPPGSHNAISRAAREAAQATGRLPHEILLSIARGEPQEVIELGPDGQPSNKKKFLAVKSLDELRSAAKDAAPYYAPKISTVEVVGSLTDANLDELIARAAQEAGVSLASVGEGAEGGSTASEEAAHPSPRTRVRLHE